MSCIKSINNKQLIIFLVYKCYCNSLVKISSVFQSFALALATDIASSSIVFGDLNC